MSDVLLRGINLPKEGIFWVSIRSDGSVSIVTGDYGLPQHGLAIFLPEYHGRLIDADALKDKMMKTPRYFDIKFDLDGASTIVPAEEKVSEDIDNGEFR